ncbi:UNVERIFIED_CONTAM: hypothetical protein B566_EDAN019208 [Ephemera danica]|nr:hypothetical protein B566_EDAN019208 [Ephemera danica]
MNSIIIPDREKPKPPDELLQKFHVGRPQCLLCDHGSQFTAKLWAVELQKEGIKVKFTSVYHPSSNNSERQLRESECPEKTPDELIVLAREHLNKKAKQRKKQVDKIGKHISFKEGDNVLLCVYITSNGGQL